MFKFLKKYHELIAKWFLEIKSELYRVNVKFYQYNINIISNNLSVISFISNYCKDYFQFSNENNIGINIFVLTNHQLFNELLEYVNSSKIEVDENGIYKRYVNSNVEFCFERDNSVGSEYRAFYFNELGEQNIYILISEKLPVTFYSPMRTIRMVFSLMLINKGCITLHSACVEKDNLGFCIIGKNFAGKTTTLINLLESKKFNFLSNSKIFLKQLNEKSLIYGLPFSFNIRYNSIKCFNEQTRNDLLLNISEHYKNKNLSIKLKEDLQTKFLVPPNQITKIFNCKAKSRCVLDSFIIPDYRDNIKHSKLSLLSPHEFLNILINEYRDVANKTQRYWNVFMGIKQSQFVDHLAILTLISEKYPAYKLLQCSKTNSESIKLVEELYRKKSW